jgi:hypothetical protein
MQLDLGTQFFLPPDMAWPKAVISLARIRIHKFTKDHCGTVPIGWCLLCICFVLVVLGCDFVIPIRGYADTRKKLRSFFLFAVILSCICFVKFTCARSHAFHLFSFF